MVDTVQREGMHCLFIVSGTNGAQLTLATRSGPSTPSRTTKTVLRPRLHPSVPDGLIENLVLKRLIQSGGRTKNVGIGPVSEAAVVHRRDVEPRSTSTRKHGNYLQFRCRR